MSDTPILNYKFHGKSSVLQPENLLREARSKNVICFAHVTNQMASRSGDFEKGEHNGSIDAMKILFSTIDCINK